jgi:hypothetical protein
MRCFEKMMDAEVWELSHPAVETAGYKMIDALLILALSIIPFSLSTIHFSLSSFFHKVNNPLFNLQNRFILIFYEIVIRTRWQTFAFVCTIP